MSLRLAGVSYEAAGRTVIDHVNLVIEPGAVHVLIGPNGAGKSTLLRLLAGDLAPSAGQALLDDCDIRTTSTIALARRRAVMMQREYLPFPFTATQVAALGRLPWNQSSESAEEQAIVQECLATAGAYHLARREYPGLSGGERARVQFARALAQIHGSDGKSRYLLLDEPTASLDFAFVHQCLDTVRAQTTRGIGALVILQDPALALRYADTVSLVERGRIIATGCAESIVTAEAIATLYGLGLDRVRMLSPAWPARS